jgi:hypothetical protein
MVSFTQQSVVVVTIGCHHELQIVCPTTNSMMNASNVSRSS